MSPHGVLESVLYARDLPASEEFYTRVLGLTLVSRDLSRHVFLRCQSQMVLLFHPDETRHNTVRVGSATIPQHGCEGQGHLAFRVEPSELASWRSRLAEADVSIETEIDWPAGGHSIYVRDPAGNSIELATPQVWGLP